MLTFKTYSKEDVAKRKSKLGLCRRWFFHRKRFSKRKYCCSTKGINKSSFNSSECDDQVVKPNSNASFIRLLEKSYLGTTNRSSLVLKFENVANTDFSDTPFLGDRGNFGYIPFLPVYNHVWCLNKGFFTR